MPHPLPCVIFAGGKSSRMGRDKALLPFGGYDSLAEYQYRRLLPLFSSVHISSKTDKFPFDAPLILDREGVYAPTAGLLAAFEVLQSDFFALAVDTPFVDEAIITELVETYLGKEADAFIARTSSGSHPMCGIYTRALQPVLEAMVAQGRHRLNDLLEQADTHYVNFANESHFYNLNTPREYAHGIRLENGFDL
jgi:molybdopterin-guanine dinucleotide biosynthesis protein A